MSENPSSIIDVYLENGQKRTFACAVDWPGWCRSAKDEAGALQALFAYSGRYAKVLQGTPLTFLAPGDLASFNVSERLTGNSTTDFGAPGIIPAADARPVDGKELERLQIVLTACWRALRAAADSASGKELRTGPRGGGRDLDKILHHVLESAEGYMSATGWKPAKSDQANLDLWLRQSEVAVSKAVEAAAHGDLPTHGPRGGRYWPARYFARRTAWHILDHTWEIEDRIQ